MKQKVITAILLSLFLLPHQALATLSFEDLHLPELLFPPNSDCYTIEAVTRSSSEPGTLIFNVNTPHAEYDVEGLVTLRQRLNEIRVIEAVKNQAVAGNVAEGVTDSVVNTGEGLKNLVVHPVDSVTGIGSAIGKMGKKVGRAFQKEDEGEKTSFGESVLGSTKRAVAKELGVDVYSRNPYLQERLDSIAKSRMGGQGIFMVANFLIPVGFVVSAVVTASSLNSAADQLINDNSRADLYLLNKKALISIGFDQGSAVMLLDSPYLTPREVTYLRFYLEKLRPVRGYERIAAAVMNAKSIAAAQKLLYEAEIAADMMENPSGLSRLQMTPEGLALGKGNELIFITGYDYLDNSSLGQQVVARARELKKEFNKNSLEIVCAGVLAADFSASLTKEGIKEKKLALFVRDSEKPGAPEKGLL
jgi:hypothetical protein